MDRRKFIGGAGAGILAAGSAVAQTTAQGLESAVRDAVRQAETVVAASEKIVVGCIGVGGRGTSVMKEFLAHPDVEVAAIADVDSEHLERARLIVEKERGARPDGFKDFRALLERKDIDAVIVGTPDHWHALPSIYACQAGKDVYCEKPLSFSIGEGAAMVAAARRNSRVTQMGNQIHNHPSQNFARAAAIVQSGALGKILKVRCWKHEVPQDFGTPADAAPPETLDYDMWLGPAPARPYNPNRSHFKFRYFWDYAGGKFSDFGCHIMDVAFWALKLDTAKSAVAIGGKFATPDNTETPDSLEVVFEYDDFPMVWSQVVGNGMGFFGMGGIGCIFQGKDATLVVNYTESKLFSGKGGNEEIPLPEVELPPHVEHAREFLNSVKSRELSSCDFAYGHSLTRNIHLGNIAYRTGERVRWDAEKQVVVGTPEAMRLQTREYRAPWKLEA